MMKGVVYKSTGSWYLVKGEDQSFYKCRMKGKFRIKGIKSTNPIAVGDRVLFSSSESSSSDSKSIDYLITKIFTRDNYIVRKSVNLSKQTHIIASNIDTAFLIITLTDPPTSTVFIDRFLVAASAYKINAVLIFNKMDTYDQEQKYEIEWLISIYEKIGYECLKVSAKEEMGLDKVWNKMQSKTTIFSGHSGVGKSTLLNAMDPSLQIKTKEVSEQHHQGQHTTTFAQMYDLDHGKIRIIDTPGIKGFGMVDIDKLELGKYFPEFLSLQHQCKFNNCLHTTEPHCAIKKALDAEEISFTRYQSYLQILEGDDKEEVYRKNNYSKI